MNSVINVMRRELTGYFATPVAYVFLIIFLVMTGIFAFYLGNFEPRKYFCKDRSGIQIKFLYKILAAEQPGSMQDRFKVALVYLLHGILRQHDPEHTCPEDWVRVAAH